MAWGYRWRPYVPVHARRARAAKEMEKLRKKGRDIQPVEIAGTRIARTFWGKAWCDHLEQFSDFENRLPRGRTYVRNGSVCHLDVARGTVTAMVSGSELYEVCVTIGELPGASWRQIKKRCAGQVGSLLELLQGRLSKSVMEIVTDRDKGMFPLPGQISLKCSCPDWAVMCKHVAAVLYGVGARLDERPELLFVLRGVDHEELIPAEAGAALAAGKAGKRKRIAADDIADVFGIEVAEEETIDAAEAEPEKKPARRRTKSTTGKPTKATRSKRAPASGRKPARARSRATSRPRPATGKAVAALRAKLGMSQVEFAQLLRVSPATVGNWEKTKGRLKLQKRTLAAWNAVAHRSE